MMRRPWKTLTTREVDAAVERQAERELCRYEAEQDRLEAEAFDFVACQARVARQLAAAAGEEPPAFGEADADYQHENEYVPPSGLL